MHHTPVIPGAKSLRAFLSLFIFICSFVSVSCTNAPPTSAGCVPSIDLETALGKARIVDLSEIASDIRYVPLETNASSLLRDFSQIFFENRKFYIGMRDFKIFSNEGKYLWTFDKSGRGPGEYTFVNNFFVESSTGNLIVDVLSRDNLTMLVYDSTGVFIGNNTITLPDSVYSGSYVLLENGSVLLSASGVSEVSAGYWAAVVDKDGKLISRMPPAYNLGKREGITGNLVISSESGEKRNIPLLVPNPYPFLYDRAGLIRLYSPFCDTIYSINSDKEFVPVFHIGYGSIPSAKEKPENPGGYGRGKFISLLPKEYKEWDKHLLLAWLMNDYSSDYHFDTLNLRNGRFIRKHTTAYGLYSKESEEFTFMKQPVQGMYGFRDDLAGGPPFIPSYISSDGKFAVALVTPQTIEKYLNSNPGDSRFAGIAKRVSFEDNPVAVIVTLR
jgi:hypothetical protein